MVASRKFPPIHSELRDQAISDSLCRTSDASRILTPVNFRLSVESGASVHSPPSVRLSVTQQEAQRTTELDASWRPPASPGSPVKSDIDALPECSSQPTPFQLPESQSLLPRTNWAVPISSSCDQEVLPISATLSSTTLSSFIAEIASASREKAEDGKRSEKPEKEQTQEQTDGLHTGKSTLAGKGIVVADEKDNPSASTFQTDQTHDLSFDITQMSIPESSHATMKGDILICTSPPTPLVGNHVYSHSLDGSSVPSQLPQVQIPSRKADIAEPLSPSLTVLLKSHLHSSSHQLTLANLREGSGTPIPGTNQRCLVCSFFLTRMHLNHHLSRREGL